jgi:hypothetical protein
MKRQLCKNSSPRRWRLRKPQNLNHRKQRKGAREEKTIRRARVIRNKPRLQNNPKWKSRKKFEKQ